MKVISLCFWLLLLPGLVLAVSPEGVAPAAGEGAKTRTKEAEQKPIHIVADRLEANDKEKVVIFTGSVIARQEDMVLNCDRMWVYYREVKKSGPEGEARGADPEAAEGNSEPGGSSTGEKKENEIERIEAEGNVKITRKNRVALADKAVYQAQAEPRVIILTGEPRVWRDKDVLTGNRIIVFVDEDRSIVEGGRDKRVEATFYQRPPSEGSAEEEASGPADEAGGAR